MAPSAVLDARMRNESGKASAAASIPNPPSTIPGRTLTHTTTSPDPASTAARTTDQRQNSTLEAFQELSTKLSESVPAGQVRDQLIKYLCLIASVEQRRSNGHISEQERSDIRSQVKDIRTELLKSAPELALRLDNFAGHFTRYKNLLEQSSLNLKSAKAALQIENQLSRVSNDMLKIASALVERADRPIPKQAFIGAAAGADIGTKSGFMLAAIKSGDPQQVQLLTIGLAQVIDSLCSLSPKAAYKLADHMVQVCLRTGFPLELMVGLGLRESHFGTKGLASRTNNIFNFKPRTRFESPLDSIDFFVSGMRQFGYWRPGESAQQVLARGLINSDGNYYEGDKKARYAIEVRGAIKEIGSGLRQRLRAGVAS